MSEALRAAVIGMAGRGCGLLNMVRQDVFGKIVYAKCAYCHDLHAHTSDPALRNRCAGFSVSPRAGSLFFIASAPLRSASPVRFLRLFPSGYFIKYRP